MINLKDQHDVQIWCDFQEETKQTDTNFFLRLRFSNFRTFLANANNYDNGDGFGDGCFYGYGNANGNGRSFGWCLGDSYGYGDTNGNGWGDGDDTDETS